MDVFGGGGGGEKAEGEGGAAGAGGSTSPTTGGPIQSVPELMAFLTKSGVNPTKAMEFLPKIVSFLKEKAGIDASGLLSLAGGGGTEGSGAGGEGSSSAGGMEGLQQMATGFLGSFTKKE